MSVYDVRTYYGTFVTHRVDADNEDEAIEKARTMPLNPTEIMFNLDLWLLDIDDIVEERNNREVQD